MFPWKSWNTTINGVFYSVRAKEISMGRQVYKLVVREPAFRQYLSTEADE
jgi:hypothetical protein